MMNSPRQVSASSSPSSFPLLYPFSMKTLTCGVALMSCPLEGPLRFSDDLFLDRTAFLGAVDIPWCTGALAKPITQIHQVCIWVMIHVTKTMIHLGYDTWYKDQTSVRSFRPVSEQEREDFAWRKSNYWWCGWTFVLPVPTLIFGSKRRQVGRQEAENIFCTFPCCWLPMPPCAGS